MKFTNQIKEINQLPKKPFGEKQDIYTYNIVTTQHQGLLYKANSDLKVGDTVEYVYNDNVSKNKSPFKELKKVSMYSNYSKEQKPEYQARLDTGRSILLQVAFKEASQAYIAGNISVDEVEQLTNMYFKIIDK